MMINIDFTPEENDLIESSAKKIIRSKRNFVKFATIEKAKELSETNT